MSKTGTILQDWQTYTWKRRRRTALHVYGTTDADDPETGDLYRTKARIVGDGAYVSGEALVTVTDDIDDVTITQGHAATVSHGDAELGVTAFRAPYTWNPAFELEDHQSALWRMHLARYRQLLKNPSFSTDVATVGNGWSWAGSAPPWFSSGGIDGGAYIGAGSASSWTTWQDVYMTGWGSVEGLRALFKCKVSSTDSDDTYRVRILADGSTIMADTTLSTVASTTDWEIIVLEADIPAGTDFVEVELSAQAVGEFDTAASVRFDACELRIGNISDELITNGNFPSVGTWTTLSGTWALSSSGTGYEGSFAIQSTDTTANAELYQENTPAIGFRVRGTAVCTFAAQINGSDRYDVVLETRNSGGSVIDSVTWDSDAFADGVFREHLIALDLEDGVEDIRFRIVQTANASGANDSLIDTVSVRIHKELHPTEIYDVADFNDTPEQVFPASAKEWEDLGGPRPTHIYLFDGPSSDTTVQNEIYPFGNPLTVLGNAALGETFAGVRVGTSYAAKACLGQVGEVSGAQGAQMQSPSAFSCDGATPWILAIPFRMHLTDTSNPIAGSYDGTRGWRVEWNSSGGSGLKLIVRGDTTVTGVLSGRHYMDGCPHVLFVKYIPVSDQITFWTEAEALASPLTVPANSHNQVGVVLGALPSASGADTADVQVPYTVGWQGSLGADDFDNTDPLTGLWWTHGTDPSGFITGYNVTESMHGRVDSDADGLVVGAYPKSSVPIFEYDTNKRGVSLHVAAENMWRNPYWWAWSSAGTPTETMRHGADASRMKRSLHITGNGANVDYRYFSVTPGAAGYVTVVVVARWPAGVSSGQGSIILADSTGVVKDSELIALTASWKRFEVVLAWDNATTTARVGFGLDQDGDELELHPIGGAYYTSGSTGYAPHGIPLDPTAATTTPTAHGLRMDRSPAFSSMLAREGEIAVRGVSDVAAPVSVEIASVAFEQNDEERRRLAVDASSDVHGGIYDDLGSETSAVAAGPADWRSEWNARLRWNYGGLMNDDSLGAQVHSDSADTTVVTGALYANVGSGDQLDAVHLGHFNGSSHLSGLIARVEISSRERQL